MNVKIEKLIYGGEGIGHAEGRTVFVPYVLPGEVVAVRAVEQKKKFIRGHIQHLVTPSPQRVPPPCPHFTACGGCHYQHLPYAAQVEAKSAILRETLSRLGRITWDAPIRVHASPPFGYRNRAQWKVRPVGGQEAIGYFRSSSSALCPVEQCAILSPLLQETLAALRRLCAARQLSPAVREFEAFVNHSDDRLLLNVSLAEAVPSEGLTRVLRDAQPAIESLLLHHVPRDRFELDGPGFLRYRAADFDFRVGHLSFFQVNRHLLGELIATVLGGVSGRLALDLFAGVGLFSVPLAGQFEKVIAVESNPAAARNLSENLQSTPSASAIESGVEQFLARHADRPDFVLLDPPRSGVAPEALRSLAALGPAQIGYLSCDPATLARDLAVLAAAGYAIRELHLFDVFPQTFHIESYLLLERRQPGAGPSAESAPQ